MVAASEKIIASDQFTLTQASWINVVNDPCCCILIMLLQGGCRVGFAILYQCCCGTWKDNQYWTIHTCPGFLNSSRPWSMLLHLDHASSEWTPRWYCYCLSILLWHLKRSSSINHSHLPKLPEFMSSMIHVVASYIVTLCCYVLRLMLKITPQIEIEL